MRLGEVGDMGRFDNNETIGEKKSRVRPFPHLDAEKTGAKKTT